MRVKFSTEEVDVLINAIHAMQDTYSATSDDLSGSVVFEERHLARQVERWNDVLEGIRKKLGDKWEPHPSYRVPDTIEGLS